MPRSQLQDGRAKVPEIVRWSSILSSPINGNQAPARATALLVSPSRSKRAISLALVLTLLMTAGGFWWMCDRNEAIAFLPARAGADWIVFPRQAETTTHDAVSVTVEFRHTFTLNTKPAHAMLAICAFKGATVAINSRQVSGTPFTGRLAVRPSPARIGS